LKLDFRTYNLSLVPEILRKEYHRVISNLRTVAHLAAAKGISRSLKEKCPSHEEFKEINVIGVGGFGKVYKAQHSMVSTLDGG